MAKHVLQQTKSTSGICRVCLCTDEQGCAEGCEWSDRAHTLCSACDGLTPAEMKTKRDEAVADLTLQRGMLREELADLRGSLAQTQQRLDFARRHPI